MRFGSWLRPLLSKTQTHRRSSKKERKRSDSFRRGMDRGSPLKIDPVQFCRGQSRCAGSTSKSPAGPTFRPTWPIERVESAVAEFTLPAFSPVTERPHQLATKATLIILQYPTYLAATHDAANPQTTWPTPRSSQYSISLRPSCTPNTPRGSLKQQKHQKLTVAQKQRAAHQAAQRINVRRPQIHMLSIRFAHAGRRAQMKKREGNKRLTCKTIVNTRSRNSKNVRLPPTLAIFDHRPGLTHHSPNPLPRAQGG